MPAPPFSPPEAWPEYGWLAEPMEFCKARETVGISPRGIRYATFPFCHEEYVGDVEPDLAESKKGLYARNRWILWKRVTDGPVPIGWRVWQWRPWRIDGVFDFDGRSYVDAWNDDARRNLKRWRNRFDGKEFVIETVSFGAFCDAYKKSTVATRTKTFYLDILSRKRALLPADGQPELWGVRSVATGEIVAGVAVHFFSKYATSVHECPFMLPGAGKVSAPTGLMDRWFSESERRGMRTMVTPYLFRPGDPEEWRGPSDFKLHFGFRPVSYPPLLVRFVRGKLF